MTPPRTGMVRTGVAAELLGCTRQYVNKLIRAGAIPALNISVNERAAWRIPQDGLARFLVERNQLRGGIDAAREELAREPVGGQR